MRIDEIIEKFYRDYETDIATVVPPIGTIQDVKEQVRQSEHLWNKRVKEAKQALYKDMLAILGEDEHYEGHLLVRQIEHRNQLRQELRTKLKEYYGVEE